MFGIIVVCIVVVGFGLVIFKGFYVDVDVVVFFFEVKSFWVVESDSVCVGSFLLSLIV